MTSPEIKLIAVDLDGTLLREDHTTLSEANRQALTWAAARGVEIVVATGRSISAVAPQVLELPFLRYFITCNIFKCISFCNLFFRCKIQINYI